VVVVVVVVGAAAAGVVVLVVFVQCLRKHKMTRNVMAITVAPIA